MYDFGIQYFWLLLQCGIKRESSYLNDNRLNMMRNNWLACLNSGIVCLLWLCEVVGEVRENM